MGDVFRRLVARTLARQFGAAFRTACAPFQYALSTRAGSEAVVRAVQTAIEADRRTTVLSIDGMGAYDHISRASMLEALRAHAPLTGLLPFASLFYGQASRYTYYDEAGVGHEVLQGEGGEQGDPSCRAFMRSANTPPSSTCTPSFTRGKDCMRFWTMFPSHPFRSAHFRPCEPRRRRCPASPTSRYTLGKLAPGTHS